MANNLVPFSDATDDHVLERGRPITTYPANTNAGRIATYNAVRLPATPLDTIPDCPIEVSHVVISLAAVVNRETGETAELPCVTMISPSGERYSTFSPYVLQALRAAAECLQMPLPWLPGLQFIVRNPRSPRTKRAWLTLELVGVCDGQTPEQKD